MAKKHLTFGLGLMLVAVATPLLAASLPGGCGTAANSGICLGEMRVPAKKAALFQAASTQAIDALASRGFRNDLAAFISRLSPADAHAAAWTKRDPDALVSELLGGVNGVEIETYGGLWALIIAKGPTQNVAREGRPGEAIQLNRYALGTSADIANSIAHEAAHRAPVALRHPSYERSNSIGYCEPPYVIGQLVQKQIEGAQWRPDGTVCAKLRT
jgi:hypothetical protein